MVALADGFEVKAGGAAEMVVVYMGDEQGVEGGDAFGGERLVDEQRHIKPFQHRVDHNGRPAGDDERPAAAQPVEAGAGVGEGFGRDRERFFRHRLSGGGVGDRIHPSCPPQFRWVSHLPQKGSTGLTPLKADLPISFSITASIDSSVAQ